MREQEKLYEILREYDDVMLVTMRQDGQMHARPMHVAGLDRNCDLWFLSGEDEKVDEIRANPTAQVVAQDGNDSWIALTGRVEIIDDRGRVEELWKEPYRAWFPRGKDDPNIRVLAFRPSHGEYWAQRGTRKITYALETLRAYMSGRTPRSTTEEHGSAEL